MIVMWWYEHGIRVWKREDGMKLGGKMWDAKYGMRNNGSEEKMD